MDEDFTGKVCVCSIGRPAVVVGQCEMPWGETWFGIGIDGKGAWYSRKPVVIANTIEEFAHRLRRFDQAK